MPLRVLIVPDKFKGTLSAHEAAQAIARGWQKARLDDALELLPMSDGGDGFGEVMSNLLGAKPKTVQTVDAAHRRCKATWWWESKTKTAIIESANTIGLAMLPPGKFHPFELDTFGLGAVLRSAKEQGARRLLIGIGGSATNDGGFGLAQALGWEFFDRQGKRIEQWMELNTVAKVCPPKSRRFIPVTVAVDVQNRLLGVHGATRVYGPQKGLRQEDFAHAESCLRRLAGVMERQRGRNLAKVPGAGAAGGLGFGLAAFLNARLQPGFEMFASHAKLSQRLRESDLVITGEGAIDRSTAMGKGVGQIARLCQKMEVPCIGLAGTAVRSRKVNELFSQIHALTDVTTLVKAKSKPALWLERTAASTAGQFEPLAARTNKRSPTAS